MPNSMAWKSADEAKQESIAQKGNVVADKKAIVPTRQENTGHFGQDHRPFMVTLFLAAGLISVVVALARVKSSTYYLCGGSAPTSEEIQRRGVPTCLESDYRQARSGVLCLSGSEDRDDPPMWCQDQVPYESRLVLWWSSCEKCGTAWRLFQYKSSDKSWLKFSASKPEPDSLPPGLSLIEEEEEEEEAPVLWQEWSSDLLEWSPTAASFRSCSDKDKNGEYVVPRACFESESNALLIGGVCAVSCWFAAAVIFFCPSSGESSGSAAVSHGFLVGGVGGGGSGGGGGGGGAGGGGGC